MSVQSYSQNGGVPLSSHGNNNQLVLSSHSPSETDQREFLKYYVDEILANQGVIPSQDEIDEMESVLFSVSFGKQEFHKKVTYQAFSAAISNQQHVQMVLAYINRRERIKGAKCKILSYRVNQRPQNGSPRNGMSDMGDEFDQMDGGLSQQSNYNNNNNQDPLLTEGFDDAGEEGSGQKLLHLLQKMGVENILIIVCIWHYRMQGQFGTDTYRMVLERAKDLLTSLHLKVLEAEKTQQEQSRMTQIMPYVEATNSRMRSMKAGGIVGSATAAGRHALQTAGLEVTTKVYPSTVIPDKNEIHMINSIQKKNYRPNNFMNEAPGYGVQRAGYVQQGYQSGLANNHPNDEEEDQLEIELTEDEFNYAVKMTEHSVRRLTKAHIIELRNQVKPHPLVEKVLNMVCVLRGCIAPNWTVAREMMQSMTFKMELMLMDVCQIKQSLIKRVIKILNSNQKALTPDNLSQISEGGCILLTWIINLVKWNAGHTKYKFDEDALGGHKIMNHALIARSQDYDALDEGLQQTEEDQRANTYGLMIGNPKNLNGQNSHGGNIQTNSNKLNKNNRPLGGNMNTNINGQQKKPGVYIQSKQMVFQGDKKLQPARGDSSMSQKNHHQSAYNDQAAGAHSLQNQLVKQYQQQQQNLTIHSYNNNPQNQAQPLTEKQQIQNMIDLLEADKKNNWEELRQRIPENEEDILRFLDTAVLEDQPTEVLVQLAQKLKERRTKLYQETNTPGQGNGQTLGLGGDLQQTLSVGGKSGK
eukprot:403372773